MSLDVRSAVRRAVAGLAGTLALALAFAVALAVALALAPAALHAQAGLASGIAVIGGAADYDFGDIGAGTGSTGLAALRADLLLSEHLILEPGFTYFGYRPAGAPFRTYVLAPELQLQLQLTPARVRPYVGAGLGFAYQDTDTTHHTDLALTAAGGVRVSLDERWGFQGEVRLRSIDPWHGSTTEWTVGLSRRIQ
jgi:Outer membrane protein beta-barrel domain